MSQGPPLPPPGQARPPLKSLLNLAAALILSVCIIIAGWLSGQNGRYQDMSDLDRILNTKTGTITYYRSTPTRIGVIDHRHYRFVLKNGRYEHQVSVKGSWTIPN